jgi:hypothetical protein
MRFFKGISAKPSIRWSRIEKNLSKTEFGSSPYLGTSLLTDGLSSLDKYVLLFFHQELLAGKRKKMRDCLQFFKQDKKHRGNLLVKRRERR